MQSRNKREGYYAGHFKNYSCYWVDDHFIVEFSKNRRHFRLWEKSASLKGRSI